VSVPKLIGVLKYLPLHVGNLIADYRGSRGLVVVEFRIFPSVVTPVAGDSDGTETAGGRV
jgi:hypothetical protein